MVVSSLSSSAKSPPLSYAERAKKAQNIRSPIEVVQPQSQRPPQPQPAPIPVTPSVSSTSSSSTKSSSTGVASASSLTSTPSTAAPPVPASAPGASEEKITNGDSHVTSNITTKPVSLADAQPSPQKPTPVNFWDRRKEEFAARNTSLQKTIAPPLMPASRSTAIASTSSSRETTTQHDGTGTLTESKQHPTSLAAEDEDDPFVVRKSRARAHVPVSSPIFSAENAEDWPEVGKAVATSHSNSSETSKGDELRTTSSDTGQTTTAKKGGAPKWIPLPLQPPVEQSRREAGVRGNRQGASLNANTNVPRQSSNSGQGRNSRNQSGRNSANHSASASRAHSNAGSVQSSPRNPRQKRLPEEAIPASASASGSVTRSSRTGSPLHSVPSSQGSAVPLASETISHTSSYGEYLSPPQGPTPYYPQQSPTVPQLSSPVYGPSSNGPQLGTQTDSSLPMPPPVHGYPYIYHSPYVPYEYGPPSAPYPYWNSHSHPDSGQHSPAYPPSATSSNYAASLPLHVQHHFYPSPMPHPPTHQPHQPISNVPQLPSVGSDNDSASKSPVNHPDASASAVAHFAADNLNGKDRKPASVVFGSIGVSESSCLDPPAEVAESTDGLDVKDNMEKAFTTLAIGVTPTDAPLKNRKTSRSGKVARPNAAAGEEKEEKTNGEPVVDPAIAKGAGSTGETRWKFGNEGLPSASEVMADSETAMVESMRAPDSLQSTDAAPAPDIHPSMVGEVLDDDFKVKDFGFGFGAPVDVVRDDAIGTEPKEHVGGEQYVDNDIPSAEINRNENVQLQQGLNGGGNGRPRRESYGGAYGGGFRGVGYNSRRGRGMNGFGRGYGRGFGRGNNGANNNGTSYSQRQGSSSYNIAPSSPYQGITTAVGDPNANYYASRPLATFIQPGYDAYAPPPPPSQTATTPAAPPMPVPLSQLSFPLDPTRFYLLGQLEYYLSPQNMAQDFFLRQRMDSRGWIPVGLIASFNRVKRLTLDYQLVLEVLLLSALVQVKDHHVRMIGWERFVLPDAAESTIESEEEYSQLSHNNEKVNISDEMTGVPAVFSEETASHWARTGTGDAEGEEEDDEDEDDVVFVMGKDEGEGMWSHERRT